MKQANDQCAWKQMKAFPAKAYGDYFKCNKEVLRSLSALETKAMRMAPHNSYDTEAVDTRSRSKVSESVFSRISQVLLLQR